ncbi:MAG TPA: hypothetical protein VFH53_10980 [Phycisphaerae bacterium]|nr:hypothetical protein [Phycisphaerae bacterium]
MGPSTGAAREARISLLDLIAVLFVALVLVAFLLPGILPQHGDDGRAQCQNNLKQIGTAMITYAAANRQRWPDVFTEKSTCWNEVGNTRTDEWDPVTGKGKPPKAKPGDNGKAVQSNTANLWLLIVSANLSPEVFVCPRSSHQFDEMAEGDYETVRDFRGETFVSYSFQNVLGEYRLTSTSGRASSMAVAADANPMRRDFWSGAPSGGKKDGVTDHELARKPRFIGEDVNIAAWNKEAGGITEAWELNSPNHKFRGQNVLYLDGHTEWRTDPYCGTHWDNIWLRRRTDVSVEIDPKNIETLRAYNDETSYDSKSTLPADSTGDSFLVP